MYLSPKTKIIFIITAIVIIVSLLVFSAWFVYIKISNKTVVESSVDQQKVIEQQLDHQDQELNNNNNEQLDLEQDFSTVNKVTEKPKSDAQVSQNLVRKRKIVETNLVRKRKIVETMLQKKDEHKQVKNVLFDKIDEVNVFIKKHNLLPIKGQDVYYKKDNKYLKLSLDIIFLMTVQEREVLEKSILDNGVFKKEEDQYVLFR